MFKVYRTKEFEKLMGKLLTEEEQKRVTKAEEVALIGQVAHFRWYSGKSYPTDTYLNTLNIPISYL